MKKMRSRIIRLSRLALILLSVTFICGCMDLGGFKYDRENNEFSSYYEALGDVTAISGSRTREYGFEDSLLNDTTVNELDWDTDAGQTEVENDDYIYVCVPFEEEVVIRSVALYVKPLELIKGLLRPESGALDVSIFLLEGADMIPEKIRRYGDPDYEYVDDPEVIGEQVRKKIEYDDPAEENAIAKATASLKPGKWSSFMVSDWKSGEVISKTVTAAKGNVLLLRFENNAGYKTEETAKCIFTFTDLLICSEK